ncbi:LolA family protein [Pontixanthobacter aquaemixtae]|uniref:Outer membrane lipoprotein carrier protein LolA n=1 Tax=Pontixanthobacter aquaemixtae TaxID=1958940 RepID=A0A844ZXX8_9SPHN|nr:outer membrane lipoprotein carrier protein LolA [Pontixanthobacter aquaemixtae]MXO91607.1 outer membrane lipoprotein carrier protein LolA [Pontixanthobacter aquaemixtae]
MSTMTSLFRKPVRTAIVGALAFALPTAVLAPAAPVEAAPGDLDKAVTALRGISTMQASFTQTDRQGQTVSGKLTLKRPGKIRFQYQDGVPLLLVSNGKSLTLIDYEVNQVQRWPIRNSPLGALLDPSRDVAKYGKLIQTTNPNVVSVEVRDPGRPEFGVMNLIFIRKGSAPGGLQLSSWVALDSQNHRTTVRLSNHRYGMSVSDKEFTYKDPRRSSRRPR